MICSISFFSDECILGVNFMMKKFDAQGSTPKVVFTVCVLLILSVGGVIFIFLNARPKSLASGPKTKAGGYEKLNTDGEIASKATDSSFGEYSDRIIDCEEDVEDEEDDIVYMSQDGTVYRKFKYGLLDDDEIELEYDDESYSYRWKESTKDLSGEEQLCLSHHFSLKHVVKIVSSLESAWTRRLALQTPDFYFILHVFLAQSAGGAVASEENVIVKA